MKRDGYKLAVASNSIRDSVVTMMQKSNLDTYLDFMLSNEDVAHPKPDPEIYRKAIGHLGLSPEQCLIVEDNENGIKAAIASGAHVLIVDNPDAVNYAAICSKIAQIMGRD